MECWNVEVDFIFFPYFDMPSAECTAYNKMYIPTRDNKNIANLITPRDCIDNILI